MRNSHSRVSSFAGADFIATYFAKDAAKLLAR
jgi:hypothetical protein